VDETAPASAPGEAATSVPPEAASAKSARVHHVAGWKVVVLWGLSVLIRVWARTLRIEANRAEVSAIAHAGGPLVFAFWHNRLFFTTPLLRLFRTDRPVVGLVSASRDGAVFAKFVDFLGVRTVRGSSSRFAREAVHSLITELHAGYHVVVTPDGPRGPMYDMKPGILLAARRGRAAIVLVGVECRQCWTLRSWDRFKIPWPGAKMIVRCARLEPADLGHGHEALARLRAQLIELNGDVIPDTTSGPA